MSTAAEVKEIADDLSQLAKEVAESESRPSAEEICARLSVAIDRLQAVVVVQAEPAAVPAAADGLQPLPPDQPLQPEPDTADDIAKALMQAEPAVPADVVDVPDVPTASSDPDPAEFAPLPD